MNILKKIPQNAFGKRVSIIAVNMKGHMYDDYYDQIVSKSIEGRLQQVGIPVIGVHSILFNKMYDPVESEDLIAFLIHDFL